MKTQYAADKPSDCRYCYYWKNTRKGCSLGEFHRHLNLKVIVTDALMGEHSPALGGVRKSSCVRSLERGDENEFTIVTNNPYLLSLPYQRWHCS